MITKLYIDTIKLHTASIKVEWKKQV